MCFTTNRYIPRSCDKTLGWLERDYDWIDLRKWEDFERDRGEYIKNAKIVNFNIIYSEICFKPYNSSLKYFRKLMPEELSDLKPAKHYQTVVNQDPPPPINEKRKAVSACLRCSRNFC